MIYTERKVSIQNDKATIDSPIILFRGDREVEMMFTIVDSKFKFQSSKGNVIDKTQAAFGQLAVALPDGTDLFTEIVETQNGVVIFSITGEMIDEIREVGFYSFHIRLYNDDKTSRITLPPVMKGIEIREPLIIEGDVENTDLVGDATVGYSMIQTYGAEEEIFDEDGNYIKTNWQTGDKITASKLNKIEETLETINNINNDIPSKTSELVNDSGFLTSVPSEYVTDSELNDKGYLTEHQDISNKADKSEIPTKTSQLTNDSGYLTNINFSLGVHSDGGIYLFVNGEPVGMGIFISNVEIDTSDGYITDDNTIMLSDNIPSGTYSIKYENEDGSYTAIGNFEI